MAQEQQSDAADPTIAVSIRLRVWPSGQRAAVTPAAKEMSLLQVLKEKSENCLPP
jgi:hypothetical protein